MFWSWNNNSVNFDEKIEDKRHQVVDRQPILTVIQNVIVNLPSQPKSKQMTNIDLNELKGNPLGCQIMR